MPVRSLSSPVLIWPDRDAIDRALVVWVADAVVEHPDLLRLGYFGSYARGDWGVGSDLDLVAVVSHAPQRFDRRAVAWDLLPLPVQAELLVYTAREWENLQADAGRFATTLATETVWVYEHSA